MKFIIVLIFSYSICVHVKAQKTPIVFVSKINTTTISKDSLLKEKLLSIDNSSYVIDSFTYVIVGARLIPESIIAYGINRGPKFCDHFLGEIKNYHPNKFMITIQDIYVHSKVDLPQQTIKLKQKIHLIL